MLDLVPRRRLLPAAVLVAAAALWPLGEAGWRAGLLLEPARVGPRTAFSLAIERRDGRPFVVAGESRPWVGLHFADQVRFFPQVDDLASPRRLCVEVPELDALWDPPPRSGDRVLVGVYSGARPLAAPAAIVVAVPGPRSTPSPPCPRRP